MQLYANSTSIKIITRENRKETEDCEYRQVFKDFLLKRSDGWQGKNGQEKILLFLRWGI